MVDGKHVGFGIGKASPLISAKFKIVVKFGKVNSAMDCPGTLPKSRGANELGRLRPHASARSARAPKSAT